MIGDIKMELKKIKRPLCVVFVGLLLVMSVAMSGCMEEEEEQGETLDISMTDEPSKFNPVSFTSVREGYIFTQIFDPLVQTYPEGKVNADGRAVAKSYEVSDDGLLYTFEIEEGITFHNGEEMTADDVVFTFDTLRGVSTDKYDIDEAPTSPRESDLNDIESIEATGDYTVEIHMKIVNAEFLMTEPFTNMFILPKDYIIENGWSTFENELIGTGPYKFVDYTQGDSITLERYDDYRFDVKTPKMVFHFFGEESAAVTNLRNGEIDYMLQMSATNYLDLKDIENVERKTYPEIRHQAIRFNYLKEDSPFQDPRVRKAFAYAINFDEIVASVQTQELADSGRSPLTPDNPARAEDLIQYKQDIDKAKQLLDEAGYPDGFSTELYCAAGWPSDEMVVVKEKVAEAGIDVEVVALERGTFYEEMEAGNPPISYVGWLGTPSPYSMMNYLMAESQWNIWSGSYNNSAFDAKIKEAQQTLDPDARNELYKEAQRILVNDDMGILYLYTTRRPQAYYHTLNVPDDAFVAYMHGPVYTAYRWSFE